MARHFAPTHTGGKSRTSLVPIRLQLANQVICVFVGAGGIGASKDSAMLEPQPISSAPAPPGPVCKNSRWGSGPGRPPLARAPRKAHGRRKARHAPPPRQDSVKNDLETVKTPDLSL